MRLRATSLSSALLLACGVATASAVLLLVRDVVLDPVAVVNDRVVHVAGLVTEVPGTTPEQWWGQARNVTGLTYYATVRMPVTHAADRRTTEVAAVAPGFFALFASRPLIGRWLGPSDDGRKVVVVSEAFWRTRLNSNPNVLGTTLSLADVTYEVVGVADGNMQFPRRVEVWTADAGVRSLGRMVPFEPGAWVGPTNGWLGLLQEHASVGAAREEFNSLLQRLNGELRSAGINRRAGDRTRVAYLTELLAGEARPAAAVLLAASLSVLLLTSLNAGLLMVSRDIARQKDLAIRQALGATGGVLFASVISQSLAVVGLCAPVAIGLTYALLSAFQHALVLNGFYVTVSQPRIIDVVAAMIGPALATGALSAVIPAWNAHRTDLLPILQRAPGSVARIPGAGRHSLVAIQVGLAVTLMAMAVVVFQDLRARASVSVSTGALDVLQIEADLSHVQANERARVWTRTLASLASAPGVLSAAITDRAPLEPDTTGIWVELETGRAFASVRAVSEHYFTTLGDRSGTEPPRMANSEVAVSEKLADQLFGTDSVMGKSVRLAGETGVRVIALVSADLVPPSSSVAPPVVYVPYRAPYAGRDLGRAAFIIVRCPARCGSAVSQVVSAAINSASGRVTSGARLGDIVDQAVQPFRLRAAIGAMYAGIAVLLALAGVYALATAITGTRKYDVGVMMSLGARSWHVSRAVVGDVVVASAGGAALGICGALLAAGLFRRAIPAFPEIGGAVLLLSASLVLGVSVAAAALPALVLGRERPSELLRPT